MGVAKFPANSLLIYTFAVTCQITELHSIEPALQCYWSTTVLCIQFSICNSLKWPFRAKLLENNLI